MTGQSSGGATSTMADSAKDEARRLVDDAKEEARSAYSEIGDRMRGEADDQTRRAAGGLHNLADELQRMAEATDGMAAGWARQGSQRIDSMAQRLETDGLDGVARDVKVYARSHPGMFLAATFGAGMLIGRVLRNTDEPMGSNGSNGSNRTPEYGYGQYEGHDEYEQSTAGRDWTTDPDMSRRPIPEPRTAL